MAEIVEPTQTGGKSDYAPEDKFLTSEDNIPTSQSLSKDVELIQLKAEKLYVHKQKIDLNEVTVRKEVITEIRTIEVPIQREELVIERSNPVGNVPAETLRITLCEEQVSIEKKLVILEEVYISKREIIEIRHINETLQREELHVETKNVERS